LNKHPNTINMKRRHCQCWA